MFLLNIVFSNFPTYRFKLSINGCNHHQEILARAEESPNFNGVAHRLLWRELHRLNAIRSGVRMGWGLDHWKGIESPLWRILGP